MPVEPKVLNASNRGYGPKQMPHAWQGSLTLVLGGEREGIYLPGIKDHFVSGDYSQAIDESLKRLKDFKSVDALQNMNEAHLVTSKIYKNLEPRKYYRIGDHWYKW